MSKRATITLDDDVDKFVRRIWAKTIQETDDTYSYSRCIGDLIRKSMK